MTTHSSPCFCNKVPPTPSLDVSLSSQNNPSGVGAFKTGGITNNFLISLKAFLASSVHLNFLAFFCKSYIGISNLPLSSRRGLRMGCRITKGVTERCIARLRLTLSAIKHKTFFQQEMK